MNEAVAREGTRQRRTCQMFQWLEDVTPAVIHRDICCLRAPLDGVAWTEIHAAWITAEVEPLIQLFTEAYLRGYNWEPVALTLSISRERVIQAIDDAVKVALCSTTGLITAIIDEFGIEGLSDDMIKNV